jgi:ketosteroid isomerase-like protein
MSVRNPEQWPSQFEEKMNAGGRDGVIALCEPVAAFVRDSKEVRVGHSDIRAVLADLIAKKPRFASQVERLVVVDDIAMLYTNFTMAMGPAGNGQEVKSRAIEIFRRQRDGSWKLMVGDPNARK